MGSRSAVCIINVSHSSRQDDRQAARRRGDRRLKTSPLDHTRICPQRGRDRHQPDQRRWRSRALLTMPHNASGLHRASEL